MIELYQKEGCPFCKKVRVRLGELGLSWVSHPTESGSYAREVLERISGGTKVPFLIDAERGVMMPESDDIIAYLEEHYAANGG